MKASKLVIDVLNYIDNNVTSSITIDSLSNTFSYEKTYLMKRFKKDTGKSIIDYINFKRVSNSLNLFFHSSSMLSIALDLGYSSLDYFSRIFKKITGVSPLAYKYYVKNDSRLSEENYAKILHFLKEKFQFESGLKYYVDSYISADNLLKSRTIDMKSRFVRKL